MRGEGGEEGWKGRGKGRRGMSNDGWVEEREGGRVGGTA